MQQIWRLLQVIVIVSQPVNFYLCRAGLAFKRHISR